ncbi:MAG: DNA repair exonuclease [Thermoplasmata archaeon]|nr:DNA repair exonuclease [Thermoplasmata archaeon]
MKFAHLADAHLGAFSKNPVLRDLNLKAFETAIMKSIEENVDFILIAGDLFHNPIPDMDIVKKSVEIMKSAVDAGIRIYAVYGSHDFSPGVSSLLDVLASTGIFKKVVKLEQNENKILLRETKDPSGISITGISGLSSSAEVKYFEHLDRDYLRKIPSPKIFVFHTTVEELKPSYIVDKNAIPKSLLPEGFDYYAGGHLHEKILSEKDGSPLIYPGALFGATYNDLDVLEKRGFFIVEDFKPRFVEIKVCDFYKKIINADGLSATELQEKLLSLAEENYEGKIVILKVKGELVSGKVGDINFHEIREKFKETAMDILLNTYGLTSRESIIISVVGETKEEIEHNVFSEISDYGESFTWELFNILKEGKPEDMTDSVFREALWRKAYPILIAAVEGKFLKKEGKEKKEEQKEEEIKIREKESKEEKKMVEEKSMEEKKSGKKVTLLDFMGDAGDNSQY